MCLHLGLLNRKLHLTLATGIVSLNWAFPENRRKTTRIVCHVLPNCIYDLILGNGFLNMTNTLTKFRDRLTQCLFNVRKNFVRFGFLGESRQKLKGTLADEHNVLAVPDTGAERNVMNYDYALNNGFDIKSDDQYREYLQFADGSTQETVGRVDTHWTFDSGETIPVSFEVLEKCCSDVIIGEEILSEHNVFEKYASSLISSAYETDSYELAPFDFIRTWQRPFEKLSHRPKPKEARDRTHRSSGPVNHNRQAEEQRRIEIWNYTYDFGATASSAERQREDLRRTQFASTLAIAGEHQRSTSSAENHGTGNDVSERRAPMIPSIPSTQSGR